MKKLITILSTFILLLGLTVIMSFAASAAGTSFNTATNISVNTINIDNIDYGRDTDYYKFTLTYPGSVYINFQHENLFDSSEYWYVVLYDEDTNMISEYSFYGSDINVNSKKVGLDKGNYYIRVVGGKYSSNWGSERYNTCDYKFAIKYISSHYWEKENNNNFSESTSIAVNKEYGASINDGRDKDFYRFTITSPGNIQIVFKHENLFDSSEYWYAVLYDENTNVISEYSFYGSDINVNSKKVGLDKGTYYIRVVGGKYSSNWGSERYNTCDYKFSINYKASLYWEKESNNSFATADNVIQNGIYSGTINNKYDNDYYRFNLDNTQRIKINFNIKKLNEDVECYSLIIYDENLNIVNQYTIYGNSTKNNFNITLNKGVYYFRIIGGKYSDYWGSESYITSDYSFKISPLVYMKSSSNTTTTATLKWSAVSGATGYEVYKYDSSKKKYVKVQTARTTKCKVSKLKSGTTYKFKVRAYIVQNNVTYYTDFSDVYKVTTKPSKATLSSVKSKKKTQATVTWKTVSGVSGYQVTYSTSKKFTKKTTKTVTIKKAKTKKTTLKKLKSGKKYYVKVRAYKTVNGKKIYGAYSTVKTLKVK